MSGNMKREIAEKFEYNGLGFSIILLNVPVRNIRGVTVPDINYNILQRTVLVALSHKSSALTGNEIRFIRQSLEMTLSEFARHFGVTHPAVIKWEKTRDNFAKITPSTELYIRLYILEHLKTNNEQFRNTFVAFDQNDRLKKIDGFIGRTAKPITIESSKMAI
jgi:transcriptional regulator with XRE-family HTH domain